MNIKNNYIDNAPCYIEVKNFIYDYSIFFRLEYDDRRFQHKIQKSEMLKYREYQRLHLNKNISNINIFICSTINKNSICIHSESIPKNNSIYFQVVGTKNHQLINKIPYSTKGIQSNF